MTEDFGAGGRGDACLCSISSLAGLCPLPSPASPRKSSTDWQTVVAAALCEDGTRGEGAVGKVTGLANKLTGNVGDYP